MSKECLPQHIAEGHHGDYLWPFSFIPRRWTSFCWKQPPVKLLGNEELTYFAKFETVAPKPIPKPGQWQLSWPLYVAFTTKGGWSFRLGARWDDVDLYYTFPAFRIWRL